MSDTPLIKGGLRGDPPAYRHPPYQGGQGGSEAKSIFYLIITTYLLHIPINPSVSVGKFTRWLPLNPLT
ncbi:MAG: hypothetical protein EWV64_04690 [Microcystis flos-aquae Ma_QC_C_20070823_S18]|uniref:Uncharacterized protein n=1 Tax=Microcystis flos-aquae Mf_QC_C_20070823_S10D TaxID=2486236 RepID=A0A552L7U3_9CHRO|nr:MAG: hypothetical protein EWV64_04690 [Microcystis flos-aquae Ma_QC_C_20070823_S18]TRU02638.1 MAG: hypothetical protein EWV65_02315 [Microcystis flos-aquae Ma_QC_C_20070823_S18D]TRV16302.1 MAG: hypothetical protein EWV45_00910 [Microcystis flos-aquae Mf_QC_C_20070823_S10D]TRV27187.1 MAG: hypothetical protein EWV72_05640 [Microcystis flos-aquae Mf_QC_C_20070823_S10]TRV33339.1 MAG: hypothetical protein EWV70_13650 [Microcystis flos-aquae Mf_QC_C_20070823_S20]TRV34015.1 MAG: hypothetical prote